MERLDLGVLNSCLFTAVDIPLSGGPNKSLQLSQQYKGVIDNIHVKLTHARPIFKRSHNINSNEFNTVFFISDIHADLRKFIQILQSNRIITYNNIPDYDPYEGNNIYNGLLDFEWISGPSVLIIIIGDLVDGKRDQGCDDPEGRFELLLHMFLHNLRIRSNNNSSEVIFTLGNHDVDLLCYNSGGYRHYIHDTATSFYTSYELGRDLGENRFNILSPFYLNCMFLCLRIYDGANTDSTASDITKILCIHAGIYNSTLRITYPLITLYNNQRSIDRVVGTPKIPILTSYIKNTDNLSPDSFIANRSSNNKDICEKIDRDNLALFSRSKPPLPLFVVGHCPTNQLDPNLTTKLGLGYDDNNHYAGCDYFPDIHPDIYRNPANRRGCVVLGCSHQGNSGIITQNNIDNPKLVLVDTALSASFRWKSDYNKFGVPIPTPVTGKRSNPNTREEYPAPHNHNEVNKIRNIEIYKLRKDPGLDPNPNIPYNVSRRQINGVEYNFLSSVKDPTTQTQIYTDPVVPGFVHNPPTTPGGKNKQKIKTLKKKIKKYQKRSKKYIKNKKSRRKHYSSS